MLAGEQHALFVFPGQGSQYVGMGSDLFREYAAVRNVYERASTILGYDVAELSFKDPNDQLHRTRFTQPALLTHSIACLTVFADLTGNRMQPGVTAGHSLGEYSALVAANALSFEDALKLVQKRGELMGAHGQGEMSAFPLDIETMQPIAERYYCAIAGCNLPDQTVVGGLGEDLTRVEDEVQRRFERKRPVRLKTEGAFHTYYMAEAALRYRSVLDSVAFDLSDVRVMSNFTGGCHKPDSADIRAGLFFQLFHPVMWYSNLQTAFAEGTDLIIEFGGGIGTADTPEGKRPNLEGMIKKTLRSCEREAAYLAVISHQSLEKAVDAVNASD